MPCRWSRPRSQPFPAFAVSFGRGFQSPASRVRLDGLLDCNALPKKGCLNAAERESESARGFARAVALSVAALNVHRIGLLLRHRERQRTQRPRAA